VVVVRSREQLYEFIGRGYKPYFHSGVKRWYLRKGQERHLIDRSLEAEAEAIARAMGPQRRVPEERVAEAIEMRAKELPVSTIVEETGIARSTFYKKLDEYEEAKSRVESLARELGLSTGVESVEPPPPPTQLVQSPSQALSNPNPLECLSSLGSSLRKRFERVIDRAAENPQVADSISNIIGGAITAVALLYYGIGAVTAKSDEERKIMAGAFLNVAERYEQQISQRQKQREE